jgi:hypothetical protein
VCNPTSSQTTATFTVQTRDGSDAVHDEDSSNTEAIGAGNLPNATLTAANAQVSAKTTWTISFNATNAVPGSGDIRVVLPAGFAANATTSECDVTAPASVTSETANVVSATELVCTLGAGDSVAALAGVSLTLSNLTNPSSAGATGSFTLQTRTAVGAVIDQNTTVTATISSPPSVGGGGGGPARSGRAGDTQQVDAYSISPPEGARARYRVGYVSGEPGNNVLVHMPDSAYPLLRLVLGAAFSGELVVTLYATAPIGVETPEGAHVVDFLEIHAGSDAASHDLTLNMTLTPLPGQRADRGLLLHHDERGWRVVAGLNIAPGTDVWAGTTSAACCSLFAVAFDNEAPTLEATVLGLGSERELRVTAEVGDNLRPERIELWVDGARVDVADAATATLRWTLPDNQTGNLAVEVHAYDAAGNRVTRAFVVEGPTAASPAPTVSPEPAATPGAPAGLALVLLLWVVARRRGGPGCR